MYLTAIDIGTKSIKAIIAEVQRNGKVSIIRSVRTLSEGIKKGEVVRPDEAITQLLLVLKTIARENKKYLKNLSFSISSPKSLFYIVSNMVSIKNQGQIILREDVDNVIGEAISMSKKIGWRVLHSNIQDLVVDGISIGSEFIEGISGRKLEAKVAVIAVFESVYKNLERLTNLVLGKKGGFDRTALFFAPFASDKSVLSPKQKDLGVTLIDIGAGTVGVVSYQDGKMVYADVFPFGADNITNDIVAGLKCDFKIADKIKEKFGVASTKGISSKEKVKMSEFDSNDDRIISRKYIAEIIEARVREMFKTIGDEFKNVGIEENLPAGVVLTGGGSKIGGMLDIVREELKLPAQIGISDLSMFGQMDSKLASELEDPEMTVAVGMLLQKLDLERFGKGSKIDVDIFGSGGMGFISRIKSFIRLITIGE